MASSGLPVMLDPEPSNDGDVHILTAGRQRGQIVVLRGPILSESRKDPECDVHELHVFTCPARG